MINGHFNFNSFGLFQVLSIFKQITFRRKVCELRLCLCLCFWLCMGAHRIVLILALFAIRIRIHFTSRISHAACWLSVCLFACHLLRVRVRLVYLFVCILALMFSLVVRSRYLQHLSVLSMTSECVMGTL